jgi:hypothetical protein
MVAAVTSFGAANRRAFVLFLIVSGTSVASELITLAVRKGEAGRTLGRIDAHLVGMSAPLVLAIGDD